jgi:xanthine dehydrogenase molybdopterin-binding subunit B
MLTPDHTIDMTYAPTIGRIVHAQTAPGRIVSISRPASDLIAGDIHGISLTGKQVLDLDPYFGPVVQDQPILAIDRVRYRGEPVAVLAAREGNVDSSAISLETAPVSPISTGAKRGDPPLVHVIDLLGHGSRASEVGLAAARTNLLASIELPGSASPASGSQQRSIHIAKPLVAPDGLVYASAQWNDDVVTVWSHCVDPIEVQRELSGITGVSEAIIRVLPPHFLGNDSGEPVAVAGAIGVEAIAVAIARKGQRPIDIHAKRSDFGWTGPRATIEWDEQGNAMLAVDAGAVAGYLPVWLDDFGRIVAERTSSGAKVTVDLIYSEQPPIAASKSDWIAALTEALESSEQ